MNELIFFLAVYAIAYIIVYKPGPFSLIFIAKEYLYSIEFANIGTELYKMLNCVFCLSFYISCFLYLIINHQNISFIWCLIYGLASSAVSYIIQSIVGEK